MKIPHDNWPTKVLHRTGWLCFILLILITCVHALYLFPGTSDFLTDADIIQLPTIFLDLQVDPGNFWGWKLPEAPYYFPDTLVFLVVNWLVQNSWWAIAVYSLVQAGLLVFALCWVYRAVGGENTTVFVTVLLGVMFLFTNVYTRIFDGIQGFITPYIYYVCSYIHFGTYIFCLICLAASLSYFRTKNKLLLAAIIAIVLLTTVSDLIFAIYFTLPFIATLIIASKFNIFLLDAIIKRFCYLIFSASLVAYIYNKYFDVLAASTAVEIKLSKIFLSIRTISIDLWRTAFSEQIFLIFTVVVPLIFLSLITYKILFRPNSKNAPFTFIISLYIILAVIFNIVAVITLGKYTTLPHSRYLTFVYYSPGLIALILISLWLEKIKHINRIALAASVTISIVAATSIATRELPSISQVLSPPDYVTCFDLNQSQAGLAQYWLSKPLIVFSQRKIQIATIKEDGQPSIGNNNRYWYTDSWSKPGTPPQFQFILMKYLNQSAIASRYGEPKRIQACADSEIWWYDDPEAVYFQLMRDGL